MNTILKIESKVNSNVAEKILGHKNGLDGVYLAPTRQECFIEFCKGIPQLTISDEERQKIKIETLESKQQEFEELKDNMENIISEKINEYSSKFIKEMEQMMDENRKKSSLQMRKNDLKLFRELSENDSEFEKIKSIYNNQ